MDTENTELTTYIAEHQVRIREIAETDPELAAELTNPRNYRMSTTVHRGWDSARRGVDVRFVGADGRKNVTVACVNNMREARAVIAGRCEARA